jgi:hypothetical protein
MKFTVEDLRSISTGVRWLSARERTALSAMLHRRQPDFCEDLDEVGTDPRCVQAYRFCTMFCALALRHAEEVAGYRPPRYPRDVIWETAGLIARGEEARIGRRACGYRKRILRYVLPRNPFDEDDTAWLCTRISTFLFLMERSVGRETTVNAGRSAVSVSAAKRPLPKRRNPMTEQPTKDLPIAIWEVEDILAACSAETEGNVWEQLVRNCKRGGVSQTFVEPVEDQIRKYIASLSEADKREIWSQTETGRENGGDSTSWDIGDIEITLENELLAEVVEEAFRQAEMRRRAEQW